MTKKYTSYGDDICVSAGGLGVCLCCYNCSYMIFIRNTIPYNDDSIKNYVYDNLKIPLEDCSTINLQHMLKYEEQRVERIKKVMDKIKDTLESRYGHFDIPFTDDTTPHSNNYLENYICEKEKLIEPFFKYSTDCLKIVLNYEEKHIEKIKEILNKTKDVLKSREG